MYNVAAMGLVELSHPESMEVNGGGDPLTAPLVAYVALLAAAAGAGFKWGYENLGPWFNKVI